MKEQTRESNKTINSWGLYTLENSEHANAGLSIKTARTCFVVDVSRNRNHTSREKGKDVILMSSDAGQS